MTVTNQDFLREVLEGFALPQKKLHPKWLYDQRGSELFENITTIPEYYPTRTEAEIFKTALPALARLLPDIHTIVEYGAGSGKKTGPVLEALAARTYIPVDIAEEFLKESSAALARQFPDVDILPVVADFTGHIPLPEDIAPSSGRMAFFPGSTIGNFESGTAVPFLSRVREDMGPDSVLLICADLIKDRAVLEAAYDDADGVTAEFNLNLLDRMNRELDANFNREAFSHRAVYDEEHGRIEMHLVSTREQKITIGGEIFHFRTGESLHTESSYKYTVDGFESMAVRSGWHLETYWTDPKDYFGVFLLRA